MRSYIKLDASFFRHPKAVAAGRDGRDLFIAGLCYSGDLLTDGFIPAGAVAALAAEAGVKNGQGAARALTMVGLWETCPGGFRAHDYDHYNSRSETVRAKRDAAKERMRELRSQDVRANNERTNANVLAREKEKERSYEPNGSTERVSGDVSPPSPPSKRKAKLTDCPPDFAVTAEMRDWAKSKHGIDEAELNRRDEHFWLYVGKTGKQYARWDLAWKDAMGWTNDRNGSGNGGSVPRSVTANHAGEDRAYLERGLPPVWGSANGGIDSL